MNLTKPLPNPLAPHRTYTGVTAIVCDVPSCAEQLSLTTFGPSSAALGWLTVRTTGAMWWELHYCPSCARVARDSLISAMTHAPANPPEISP